MKMKVITITDKNINSVYGRLKKFFSGRYEFQEWHNFNCGFKKRISNKIEINHHRIPIVHNYKSIQAVEMNNFGICIRINESCGELLQIGDRVAFLGNRVTLARHEYFLGNIYTTYQATPRTIMPKELDDYPDDEDDYPDD